MARGKKKQRQAPFENLPWETRLNVTVYNKDDCNAAIRGQKIPGALGLKIHRMGVISGIRHHDGFAHELRGLAPEFTRALNARAIMSGMIPDINDPSEMPYCIWYPNAPPQDTLRELVKRYPNTIYHAARACAVAGYSHLYAELQVLPEVHTAAEARDASLARNNKGSEAIYEQIMSNHLKFEVMNDYDRTINLENPRPASLNGDTAVFSDLNARLLHSLEGFNQESYLCTDHIEWRGVDHTYKHFDITEDRGIGDHSFGAPSLANFWPYLSLPLPPDLPPINKDNLILAAAYSGNVDRYTRLRRPHMIEQEFHAVILGIHYHPPWARWWSTQVPEIPEIDPENASSWDNSYIRRTINLRRIISDDISFITPNTPDRLIPRKIWWPTVASRSTYLRLAWKRPHMLESCLRACIVADYQDTWDELLIMPLDGLNDPSQTSTGSGPSNLKLTRLSAVVKSHIYAEAKDSSNPHYLEDIKLLGATKLEKLDSDCYYLQDMRTAKRMYSPRSTVGDREISKDRPFVLTTSEVGRDSVPEHPRDLGFIIFGMDAIGLENKAWEKHHWLRVENMYEILGGTFES